MISGLIKRVAAEWALHHHNKQNRRGVVSPDAQEYFVIPEALPAAVFQEALKELEVLNANWVRSHTDWRQGAAIGGHELRAGSQSIWLDYLMSDDFLIKVRRATGINDLQYVPVADTNRLSLLLYEGAGDGIDWHVDGSIYLGQRWAGILVLLEETSETQAKLELAPGEEPVTLPKAGIENSLVLFRGDHVRHRVRPMREDERRVVVSLLFTNWPQRTMNPFLLRYQSRVNSVFYNNPRP
ncbi:MAG: 2OG-Fe(II) oxygenase [Pseudomonadales bacterium]|nr:2OG-Fe(II) oxygenase [Pseudomonadales bacterium]